MVMKKFLTEALGKEIFSKNDAGFEEAYSDYEIDDEKDCEEEYLRSTRDNFLLWKDFQRQKEG